MDFQKRINELSVQMTQVTNVDEVKTITEDIRRVREAYAVDRELRGAKTLVEVTDPEQFRFEAERRLAQVKE